MIKRCFTLLMILLLAFPFSSCRPGIQKLLEPGVSDALASYRKRHISQVEYDLLFRIPDQRELPLTGEAVISFHQNRAQRGVILDFRGGAENIHSLIVNGIATEYQFINDHIVIPSQHIIPGMNRVEVAFTATDQALNRSDAFMYTLFVPDRAATAFPCFDQPDIKATFSLTLEIPADWTALANGPQVSSIMNEGRKTIQFAPDKPISTYLFAFTAGQYERLSETRDGRTITLLHRETDREKLDHNIPRIFQQHFDALEWLEAYTGIDYPFAKFDLAIIPGFQYSGMEHPGAVWYRDNRLFLDKQAPVSQQMQKANLIAHETAHMWFGNLVTMKWFDDVWLKEVFAGLMADKMVEPMFPDENHDLQFVLSHFPRAYAVDRSQGTHPIRQELKNMNQAGTLYGAIIYNKAPIVFRQLERIMGEVAFQKAVQEYLMTYSFENADWDELVFFFDKHSTENISAWSSAWVDGQGMPEIEFDVTPHDTSALAVNFLTTNISGQVPYPTQWLEMAIIIAKEPQRREMLMPGREVSAILGSPSPASPVILPNGFGWGYGNFVLREAERAYLLQQLHLQPHDNVRAAGHLLLWEDFLNANIPPENMLERLKLKLSHEAHPMIISYLLGNTQTVFWNFMDEPKRHKHAVALSKLLWERLHTAGEGLKGSFLKSWAATAIDEGSYRKMEAMLLGDLIIPGYSLTEDDRYSLVSSLFLGNYPSAREQFDRLVADTQNPDRVRRLEYLRPALSPNPEHRAAFFEQLKDPANRRPEPWALDGLELLHHPLRSTQSIGLLQQTLELTLEIQQTGDIFFPLRWLNTALNGYSQPEALEIVESYLAKSTGQEGYPGNLLLKVFQASDMLERSIKVMEKY
jgi:aminopeptidase N